MAEQPTTTVSTKGQAILPKTIRQALRWEAGTRLVVENTTNGVLLRPAAHLTESWPEDVFGSLAYQGAPKSLAEAKRRHAGAVESRVTPFGPAPNLRAGQMP